MKFNFAYFVKIFRKYRLENVFRNFAQSYLCKVKGVFDVGGVVFWIFLI